MTRRPALDVVVTVEDLGADLGSRGTLVQFSSAFCSPCRATRTLLRDVADHLDGIVHVDVDAESHLELVRRLQIDKTPTVLVLDHEELEQDLALGRQQRGIDALAWRALLHVVADESLEERAGVRPPDGDDGTVFEK